MDIATYAEPKQPTGRAGSASPCLKAIVSRAAGSGLMLPLGSPRDAPRSLQLWCSYGGTLMSGGYPYEK